MEYLPRLPCLIHNHTQNLIIQDLTILFIVASVFRVIVTRTRSCPPSFWSGWPGFFGEDGIVARIKI
jgi:hypothetical protein